MKVEKFDSVSKGFYIVVRNVRYAWEDKPALKPYHEWYFGNRTRNLDEDLRDLRENVKKQLMTYAKPGWDLWYVSTSGSTVSSLTEPG